MTTKRHKNETKTAPQMTFTEQAKSISATVINLERLVRLHVRTAEEEEKRDPAKRDAVKTLSKCIRQISTMRDRLLD